MQTTPLYPHAETAESASARERIAHWLDRSFFRGLNANGTKGRVFIAKATVQSPDADILIQGERINIGTDFIYLGMAVTSNIDFEIHVNKMIQSITYNLANVQHIRAGLSQATNITMDSF